MLYDGWVYQAGDKGTDIISRISDADVSMLNMLQVVSASENVYYSDWNHTERVVQCIQRGLPLRAQTRSSRLRQSMSQTNEHPC